MTKREKYTGDGKLRVRYVYSEFQTLAGKLPIATTSTLYDPSGDKLGTVAYSNVKANVGLAESLFSIEPAVGESRLTAQTSSRLPGPLFSPLYHW